MNQARAMNAARIAPAIPPNAPSTVFRGLMRVFNMLEPPDHLLRDPELVLHALPALARTLRGDGPAPAFAPVPRAVALARLGADDEAMQAERFGG